MVVLSIASPKLRTVMKRKREDTAETKGTAGPKVRYTLDTLPTELQKCFSVYSAKIGTGISGIDCFRDMMTGFGWTGRRGTV